MRVQAALQDIAGKEELSIEDSDEVYTQIVANEIDATTSRD